MGRTGHSGESRDVLCFLMQHSLLFAISNGRIRNIQSESICNMEMENNPIQQRRNETIMPGYILHLTAAQMF